MMKRRMLSLMTCLVVGCVGSAGVLSADAAITVRSAEVLNGVAVVQGRAPRNALISWEGAQVTQANNGGNFSFQGVVPDDCVGRLEDGVAADAIDVALTNCAPVSVPEAPAPVPQTGQTTSFRPGDDGDVQAGVAWPVPRLTDQGNGTVRDHLTGLVWLKKGDCFVGFTWFQAIDAANALASGACDLTDGSVAGDWRLPNIKELISLYDYTQNGPPLPVGHPFTFIQIGYWSSTTSSGDLNAAFVALMQGIGGEASGPKGAIGFAFNGWAVRGPE